MLYLMYEALPTIGHSNAEEFGGAFISCWINTDSQSEAEKRALAMIESSGWSTVALEESQLVELDHFVYSDEVIERINQAKIDGEVIVVHRFPKDDAGSD